MGHGLHDVGAGHEHVARAFDHDREVGHRRRIDGPTRARSHDHADLRHDTRGEHVAQEDLRIAAQGRDALLDPRAAGIIEPDHWGADLHREIHDLADLLGVRLRQRSAEDREVLAEDKDEASIDGAMPGHHAVAEDVLAVQAELRRSVRHERVELDERPRIQQQVQAFPRGQLSERVLPLNSDGAAAEVRLGPHSLELLEPFVARGHVDLLAALRSRAASAGSPSYAASRNSENGGPVLSTQS